MQKTSSYMKVTVEAIIWSQIQFGHKLFQWYNDKWLLDKSNEDIVIYAVDSRSFMTYKMKKQFHSRIGNSLSWKMQM